MNPEPAVPPASKEILLHGVRFCSCSLKLQNPNPGGKTIILRGANAHLLTDIDEIETRPDAFIMRLRCGAILEASR